MCSRERGVEESKNNKAERIYETRAAVTVETEWASLATT